MPEDVDVFRPVWDCVVGCIEAGQIGVTAEVYDELCHISGKVGECIRDCKSRLLMEVNDTSWDGRSYISHFKRMSKVHHEWIADYTGKNRSKTIVLNDLTAVALAKSLGLPLISMESSAGDSPKHKRIPDICGLENVLHLDFNAFLRIQGARK
jgi:hypothetical protein